MNSLRCNKISHFLLVLGAFAVASLPLGAHAHLSGGDDRQVGQYLVDFGYDPSPLVADERAAFSLELFDDAGNPRAFSVVGVRVASGEKVMLDVSLKPSEPHRTKFVTTLPTPGDYQVDVEFADDDVALVTTTFLVTAEGSRDRVSRIHSDRQISVPVIGIGIAVLAAIVILVAIYRNPHGDS